MNLMISLGIRAHAMFSLTTPTHIKAQYALAVEYDEVISFVAQTVIIDYWASVPHTRRALDASRGIYDTSRPLPSITTGDAGTFAAHTAFSPHIC